MDAVVYELNLIRQSLELIALFSGIGAGYLVGTIAAKFFSVFRGP